VQYADTMGERLPRSFYARHGLQVAPELLGLVLVHETPEGTTAGRIVEVEAYIGPEDRACHAFAGRRTRRNEIMWGPAGYAYVYFVYGMHYCLNVVCGEEGTPHAVLIRGMEPVLGLDLMASRRGFVPPSSSPLPRFLHMLAAGPGRLCQAMGITTAQNGTDLVTGPLYLVTGKPCSAHEQPPAVACGPRIGIGYAGEAQAYPWRFYIPGSPGVSNP